MVRKGLLWNAIILAAMGVLAVVTVSALPGGEAIPVHFGPDGQPDRYGSRAEVVLAFAVLLGTTALVAGLLAVLPSILPKADKVAQFERVYLTVWLGTTVFMALVTAWVASAFLTGEAAHPKLLLLGIPLLIVWLGNLMPKMRPNWIMGVRTPWTLTSDEAWLRTHRVTGRAMVGCGLLGAVGVVFSTVPWAIGYAVASGLLPLLFGVGYSYFAWREAGDRRE